MATNGKRRPPRPRIEIEAATASPEEAAAIAAASSGVALGAARISIWGLGGLRLPFSEVMP